MHLISPAWGPLDASQALQALSDSNPDFAVIGICSAECTSTNSSTVAATLSSMLTGHQQQPSPSAATSCMKQLHGLKIHVHPVDRLIVLDASNILSPDVLTSLLSPERPQPAVGSAAAAAVRAAASKAGSSSSIPVEGVGALLALQLLVFLLAVCNVVVISSPEFDTQLLQLLEAAAYITTSIPDLTLPVAVLQQQQQSGPRGRGSSSSSAGIGRSAKGGQQQQQLPYHLADLVLVQGCDQQQEQMVQQLQRVVDACLSCTAWADRAPIIAAESSNSTIAAADVQGSISKPQQQQQHVQQLRSGVAIWALPAAASSSPDQQQQQQQRITRPSPALQQLVNKLLCIPRTVAVLSASSSSKSASSLPATGAFARVISEREWLRGAERVWEAVQNSGELLQYYSLAAVARYTNAGGWRQR